MNTRATEAAFADLVRASSARLYRLALRMLGNPVEAEDALQETYLRAHLALDEGLFEGRASAATWLYRVTLNVCLDALRRRRRRQRFMAVFRPVLQADPGGIEAGAMLQETAAWLEELPPEQRAALVLTQVEGLSNLEAARALDCSEGAVEQRLIRARATLRRKTES